MLPMTNDGILRDWRPRRPRLSPTAIPHSPASMDAAALIDQPLSRVLCNYTIIAAGGPHK